MRTSAMRSGLLAIVFVVGGCATASSTASSTSAASTRPAATVAATTSQGPSTAAPGRVMLVDTDVAGDDLIALAFVLSSPQADVAGITVSGTGEAHCPGGIDVVLRLLEVLDAPDIPVACGRETPLAGTHGFPDGWRERVDQGSGLDLPATPRRPFDATAVELIELLAEQHPGLVILTLGPVTNLADALLDDPGLAERLGPVYVMGGALHVRGNILGPGAPTGNTVAEWNIYVDPHAVQVVVDGGLEPWFVSLDGTSQVPVTPEFAALAMEGGSGPAGRVLRDVFAANPFMTDGSYFLWDPLAAQLAAGYPVGSFTPAAIVVEEAEGPESGFTRPMEGTPNVQYLTTVDPGAAESTLLDVLNGG